MHADSSFFHPETRQMMELAHEMQTDQSCIAVRTTDSDQPSSTSATTESNGTPSKTHNTLETHAVSGRYTPQFNSASSFILSRIRAKACPESSQRASQSTGTDLYGEGQIKESEPWTMALPKDTAQSVNGISLATHHERIAFISSGLKRKRNPKAQIPDFTQSTISCPASMISAGSMSAAALPEQPVAERKVSSSVLKSSQASSGHSSYADINHVREKRLSTIASGISPAKSELVGFFAGSASDAAVSVANLMSQKYKQFANAFSFQRTKYFLGKKRTDLLNILSFCDQLRPQLLADILVSVSKKHPELPIFDSPNWETSLSRSLDARIAAAVRLARPVGRPRHGHTVLNPKARQRQKNAKNALRRLILAQHQVGTPDEEEDVEEDVLPPTWPKAGEGLYAKLPPETEDRRFLADDNDDESFSQFMVDNFGKPIIVSTCA